IHLTADNASNPEMLERFIDFIKLNGLNSIIIDINESGWLLGDWAGAQKITARLLAACINPIGRFVVFKADESWMHDVNTKYREIPELLRDNRGVVWRDRGKNPWLNPLSEMAQKMILDLMAGVAEVGFRTIQMDYLRFPTDGSREFPIQSIKYHDDRRNEVDVTPEIKSAIINSFTRRAYRSLKQKHPTVRVAVDLFGYSALITDKRDPSGNGQDIREIARNTDEIVSMAYPGLFDPGYQCDIPAKCPDKVIRAALTKTNAYLKADYPGLQFCAYLQAFTVESRKTKVTIPYGPREIRTQIEEAEKAGVTCWYLWNPVKLEGARKKFPFQPEFFPPAVRRGLATKQ
ncbi:MAG: hypothetical protein HYT40_03000, partial [Candidatus Sungbacteria bacterium]|nr:hypothetical protein [Candidatus Sungbacteria bacterium]